MILPKARFLAVPASSAPRLVLMLLLLVGVSLLTSAASAGGLPVAPAKDARSMLRASGGGDALTPVLQRVNSRPHWFKADDGKLHLSYELVLTNNTQLSVEVASVAVLTGSGRRISRLTGERLTAAMGWGTGETTNLGPFQAGIVWIDLTFPSYRALPKSVKHRLTVKVPPGFPIPRVITDTSSTVRIERRPPMQIAAPLRGSRWGAILGAHRRAILPVNGRLRLSQRFAIDFGAKLDRKDRTHKGAADRNENYFSYNKPVFAVGPGTVVEMVDRFPDQVPDDPDPVGVADADGNHVVLKLTKGVFAGYAHLKPGSVRVKVGDRVPEGKVLGMLGNSGNTTGPHLHFQLMNRPSFLDADGLPFVFDRFRLQGRITSLDALIDADRAGTAVPIDRSVAGNYRRLGLTDLDLIAFPKTFGR